MKCDHPTSTKDGFIEVSNFRGSYVYGSRATYHCNPGYILWGNSTRSEEFQYFDICIFDSWSGLIIKLVHGCLKFKLESFQTLYMSVYS